jgi:hypothetical protein
VFDDVIEAGASLTQQFICGIYLALSNLYVRKCGQDLPPEPIGINGYCHLKAALQEMMCGCQIA